MKQTLVIGSTVADVILSVPRLPGTGEDINITAQTQRLGGCAFIVAGILKLAGIPHTLCSPVGSGLYGDFVAAELEKLGMPCFVRLPDTPNGCCYCLVENSGERTFLCKHGAEYLFSREWMQNADCGRADSAYICGLEIEEECGGEIIAFLQSRPEYTVYFAPGARFLHIPQDRVQAIFDMHPVLHLNETEALTFTAADGTVQDDSSTISKAARLYKDMMMNGLSEALPNNETLKAGTDLTDALYLQGTDAITALTDADLEAVYSSVNETTENDSNGNPVVTELTRTVELHVIPEEASILRAVDIRDEQTVLELLNREENSFTVDDYTLSFTGLTITAIFDAATDELLSLSYDKSMKVSATVTGTGTLAPLGTQTLDFDCGANAYYQFGWADQATT